MTHNEYWKAVWDKAHDRLDSLLSKCGSSVEDILENDNGITCAADGKLVLAYILRHRPSCEEEACAILSVFEAVQAVHELCEHEHEDEKVESYSSNGHAAHPAVVHSPVVVK